MNKALTACRIALSNLICVQLESQKERENRSENYVKIYKFD